MYDRWHKPRDSPGITIGMFEILDVVSLSGVRYIIFLVMLAEREAFLVIAPARRMWDFTEFWGEA